MKNKKFIALLFSLIFVLSSFTTAFARELDKNLTYVSSGSDKAGSYNIYLIKSDNNTNLLRGSKYFEFLVVYNGHVSERYIDQNHWFSYNGYSGFLQLDSYIYTYDGMNPETFVYYSGYLYN